MFKSLRTKDSTGEGPGAGEREAESDRDMATDTLHTLVIGSPENVRFRLGQRVAERASGFALSLLSTEESRRLLRATALVLCLASALLAQTPSPKVIPLWPDGAPGAVGKEERDVPTLSIYLPQNSIGTGIIVFPGGGYVTLAMDHEGKQVAEWLNSHGIAAFVLKYRLGPRYHHPAPLQDAQRAIRYVRFHAKDFGIFPDRIGVLGFSAGGHLAATAGTHFEVGNAGAADEVERTSSRPDFLVLAYPVISFTAPFSHVGSRRSLLGEAPDQKLLEDLSNEKRVTPQTPPTFLFHTTEDRAVPPENSIAFYLALRKAGVPAELHIYERGQHGVGLAPQDPILTTWKDRLIDWLKTRGLFPKEGK